MNILIDWLIAPPPAEGRGQLPQTLCWSVAPLPRKT